MIFKKALISFLTLGVIGGSGAGIYYSLQEDKENTESSITSLDNENVSKADSNIQVSSTDSEKEKLEITDQIGKETPPETKLPETAASNNEIADDSKLPSIQNVDISDHEKTTLTQQTDPLTTKEPSSTVNPERRIEEVTPEEPSKKDQPQVDTGSENSERTPPKEEEEAEEEQE